MVKNFLKRSTFLFERQQSSILSAATIITGAVFLSGILGLIKNRLLVSYFYNDPKTLAALDAYLVAFRLPDLIFQLLVIGALSAAFIPVYSRYHKQDPTEANIIANSMMNLILLVFFIVSIGIFFFAVDLNRSFTSSNFSYDQLLLSAKFTRIMLLAQFFFAISNFLTGVIQANKRFLIPALSPLAYNLGIIIGIITLGPSIGLYGPTIGVVLGSFLHLLLQFPLAIKLGFTYKLVFHWRHPGVREISRLMLPRTAALSINQIEPMIMTYVATALSQGSLIIVNLASQLVGLPVRIVGMSIGQASLPFLSQESNDQNYSEFKQILTSSLHQILYLAFPATAVLIILRIPAVRLAYGSSSFPWQATLLTGKVAAIYSISIFSQAINHLLTRAFYALHNTTIPFVSAVISVMFNISLTYYLVFQFKLGLVGLAIAGTIAVIIQTTILFLCLIKTIGMFNIDHFFTPILKMTLASLLTGLFLWAPMRLLDEYVIDTTHTLGLITLTIIVFIIGASVYLALSKVFEINELNAYFGVMKKIGNWQKVLSQSEETIDTSEAVQ